MGRSSLVTAVLALAVASSAAAQDANRITVIVDAFGASSDLERDWGYSALVEYGGRRILFDTGNDSDNFARNAERLGIDLTRLDAVGTFGETPELSLVLDTPDGQVVVVGCSHPGIERILASVDAKTRPVHLVAGGLHPTTTPDEEVDRVAGALRDEWKVARIAPGHCTGEYAFLALRRIYAGGFVTAGVGTVVPLPATPHRTTGIE